MTFIKDYINVLSAASISFLLLSSTFACIVYFNLLEGRLRSKSGSIFIWLGVVYVIAGLFIRPLLYLAFAYFAVMFILANLGPRLWDKKVGVRPSDALKQQDLDVNGAVQTSRDGSRTTRLHGGLDWREATMLQQEQHQLGE